MSLSNLIQSQIDNTVKQYINIVSEKYNLDTDALLELWFSGKKSSNTVISSKAPEVTSSVLDSDLQKLSRSDLVAKCKEKGLKVSGNKNELIQRLTSSTSAETPKASPKPTVPVKPQSSPVLQKLASSVPSQVIARNQFGNFEHTGSGLVFNNSTKKVFGRQNPDGSVSDLTSEDIELCNKFKFNYSLPENLDKKTLDIKDEDLKELEDEGDEELDEMVEEEDDVEVEEDDDDGEEEELYYDEE